MTESQIQDQGIIPFTIGIILMVVLIVGALILIPGILNPNIVAERTFTPASHALYGIVAILPGSGSYCVQAETLSRGQPVTIGLHYIVQVPTTPDRFGSTKNEQRGITFTADNNHAVNETVVVPEGATDAIITASYSNYVDTNQVHVRVEKCGGLQ